MAGIDTRIMVTDPNGKGRYLAIRSFDDRLTITDESTGQVMTIALTLTVEGENTGDQTAETVPLAKVWGVSADNLQDATEQLSGELGAVGVTPYILRTPQPLMSASTALSELDTGILRNTKGTGELAVAAPADFPTLNQDTTGNAGSATRLQTTRAINGVPFNGMADISVTAPASDVSAWAKAATKPTYTATEVGAVASRTAASVNAAATDLATTTALVNQLRSILIAHNMAV